jgi:adenylate kinase
MRLVFFGPPGAGKGTQAKLLVQRFGLTQVSTGDLFRAALKGRTTVGLEASRYIDAGKLVPDDVVNRIVQDALDDIGRDDFVLDGFPRTLPQAEWLLDFLALDGAALDAVISMRVDEDVIVQRLSQRRMDPETGAIYHLDFNPPPADVPDGRLVQRSDDRPEAIRERLSVYHELTEPLKDYYDDRGLLRRFDGTRDKVEVHDHIRAALATLRLEERL